MIMDELTALKMHGMIKVLNIQADVIPRRASFLNRLHVDLFFIRWLCRMKSSQIQ